MVRFECSDVAGESVVEAGVDAFKTGKYMCVSDVQITTASLPDWTAQLHYSQQLECTGGTGAHTWCDKHGDLAGTGLTLSPGGLLSGVPDPGMTITFTAFVGDEIMMGDERLFEFVINDVLQIINEDVPDGLKDEPYSCQLTAEGGTGEKTWTDKNGDLAATGLGLSSEGLIDGTPVDTGTITFIARVEDEIGAGTEMEYTFHIDLEFVCGDLNGDLIVNLLDITCLINYLYKGGEPPLVLDAANVNNDGDINLLDITYLINYLYKGGPAPNCP